MAAAVFEVDGFAKSIRYRLGLVVVEDVRKFTLDLCIGISGPFYSWESVFWLLHVIVYRFVEVLIHVSLHDDWEVIAIPLSLRASVKSEDHRVKVVTRKYIWVSVGVLMLVASAHSIELLDSLKD